MAGSVMLAVGRRAPVPPAHGPLHRLLDSHSMALASLPTGDPGGKEPHRRDPFCDLDSGVISITLCHILFVRRERRIIESLFGERTGLPTWLNSKKKKKKKLPAKCRRSQFNSLSQKIS